MRVAIATLGCKVNQYDSAVIERACAEHGWQPVAFDSVADAYVVNTCTVTDRADGDARKLARKARRANAAARVILTGCYAQTSPAEIAGLDYVDYVVGLGKLPDLLRAVQGELDARVTVGDLRHASTVETFGIESFPGRTRAFVKVQEGCNLFCTYCIIPVARGRSRSVAPRVVLEEIDRLAARGYREVVLTGVHLGGYGRDLDERFDLAYLLESLAEHAPSVRIRLSSIDPPEITDRLLEVVADSPLYCRHFHVPLQAGDDRVLGRMKRLYSAAEAADALSRIRARIPGVSIGTDVITGFPDETEAEYRGGLDYLARVGVDYLHVFPYSKRRSTSAAKRWAPVPPAEIARRAATLRDLDRTLRARWRDRFVGVPLEVLFESARDRRTGMLRGYSDNYLPVLADAGDRWMNRIARVTALSATDRALIGGAPQPLRAGAVRGMRAPDELRA
jgi:threonylcarbamoyladenosine tRNA methylthiotransferase MtaB